MAKRRRRRISRIRYTPRRRRRHARRNPFSSSSMLLLAGAGVVGYLLWKKYKAQPAAAVKPAGTSASVTVGGTTVTAQLPTSGWGAESYGAGTLGSLGSGGLGSLG